MKANINDIVKIVKPGNPSDQSNNNGQKTDTLDKSKNQKIDQDKSSKDQNEGPSVNTDTLDGDTSSVTIIRGPKTGEVISQEEGRDIAKKEGIEESSRQMTEEKWKETARKASIYLDPRNTDRGRGKGAIFQRIMELTEPKVNWKQELARILGKMSSSSSFKMPNRRHVSSGQYRYGLEDTEFALENAAIAMDVSGSIASDFPELAAEVVGIVKAKKIKNVSILPFANEVVDPFQIKGSRRPSPDDFAKVRTGGGTEAMPNVIDWIDTNLKGKVDVVIVMTDGYLTNGMPSAPKWGNKTIWLIFDNPRFDIPPDWGRVIHINGISYKK
jgi:predicted metal-dependent peptidase